ncbi:hypothetical protein [Sulfuracidifex metallicus]|uniref:Uncharacterized protein n=1 Tax=Sulfuracidifex metallicus DSM 6482 = JCM 9184 TaxID=523847 RepID=A0A6A9QQE0_SULME|nr:hypothetical protein [Sulfuracidifex metallicus]MUN29505.1 hypothetical protein [Sulfuracidifex metallicus DSM 6482 = JCM 9184]WOE49985.1 hypothetical protein RQ359_001482 [Sulfuracidifex metallicus DSM 6482 = JCM 9184]
MKDEVWKRIPWHIGENTRKLLEEACQNIGIPQLERCSDKILNYSIEMIRIGEDITQEEERYAIIGFNVLSSSFFFYRLLRLNGKIRENVEDISSLISATVSSINEETGTDKAKIFMGVAVALVRLISNVRPSVEKNTIRANLTSIDDETASQLIDLLESTAKKLELFHSIEKKGIFFKLSLKYSENVEGQHNVSG